MAWAEFLLHFYERVMGKKKSHKNKGKAVPLKKQKVTPSALIAGGLGLACIIFGLTGVFSGKPGGYYLMGLGLLFVAALGIGALKK